MLQHTAIDRVAIPVVLRAAAGWQTMAELERAADTAVADLRARRTARANDLGGLFLSQSAAELSRNALNNRQDWPYLPELVSPWYGQFH